MRQTKIGLVAVLAVLAVSGCEALDVKARERAQAEEAARAAAEEAARIDNHNARIEWFRSPEMNAYMKAICEMAPGPARDAEIERAKKEQGIFLACGGDIPPDEPQESSDVPN